MDKQPVECPECGAPNFAGQCPTCIEVRSIRFGKSWFQEAVDLAMKACRTQEDEATR